MTRKRRTPPRGQPAATPSARRSTQSAATSSSRRAASAASEAAKAPDRSKRDRAVAAAAKLAAGLANKQATSVAQKQVGAALEKQRTAHVEQQRLDELHMQRALELAAEYRGRTSPNPIVGCVIVDAVGNVIAEGVHRGPGTKHAEIDALEKLGGKAPGATLYVNLEPCTHHGRTPPCAPVVAAAGLARVVVGSEDPIADHGGGLAFLRKAGIQVSRALEAECDLANVPFRTWALERRAAFTLKAAVTLDGKISTVDFESKWITGEPAREHGHWLRSTHDAILVGIGTVLADDPQLTSRIAGGRNPVRVVIDSKLRTPPRAKLLPGKATGAPRTIIATTERAPIGAEKTLAAAGAEVWRFPARRGHVALDALATRLAEEDLLSVLVEGGGQVHAALLAEGLATDIQLFIAPVIVGGAAPSWVGGVGVGKLAEAWRLQFVGEPRRVGEDLVLRAMVLRNRG